MINDRPILLTDRPILLTDRPILQAELLLEAGDINEAIDVLDRAIRREPGHIELRQFHWRLCKAVAAPYATVPRLRIHLAMVWVYFLSAFLGVSGTLLFFAKNFEAFPGAWQLSGLNQILYLVGCVTLGVGAIFLWSWLGFRAWLIYLKRLTPIEISLVLRVLPKVIDSSIAMKTREELRRLATAARKQA